MLGFVSVSFGMSIHLATGSEAVSDLLCTVLIVFCDIGGHSTIQHVPCWILKKL